MGGAFFWPTSEVFVPFNSRGPGLIIFSYGPPCLIAQSHCVLVVVLDSWTQTSPETFRSSRSTVVHPRQLRLVMHAWCIMPPAVLQEVSITSSCLPVLQRVHACITAPVTSPSCRNSHIFASLLFHSLRIGTHHCAHAEI